MFADKTGRIGRNVGNFIQSHGLIPNRRAREASNTNPNYGNAGIVKNGFPGEFDRLARSKRANHCDVIDETNFHAYPRSANEPRDRYVNDNTVGNEELAGGTHVIEEYHRNIDVREYRRHQDMQVESRAVVRLDHVEYGRRGRKKRSGELELARNGNFEGQRLYSSLPRRNGRTRNWRDAYSLNPNGDARSLSVYPRSMQDLTDLDIERILERDTNFHVPLSSFRSRDSLVERYRRKCEGDEDEEDENYLTLYKSLSSGLESGKREKLYVPGRVHYEREYRIYGKDTVALIYYKTCYL